MRGAVILIIGILFIWTSGSAIASNGGGHRLNISDVEELTTHAADLGISNEAMANLQDVLHHLEKRQSKYREEEAFVEYLYYFTHRKLLKSYTKYPTLGETLEQGDYDCLTATAIYSILLSELHIKHAVIETNYHIYIIVNPDTEKQQLIETTDPRYGLISDQEEIEASQNTYLKNNLATGNSLISFDFNIERRLEQKELIGLLYYNQSIKELNDGNWDKARQIAERALEYYSQTRVSTLINIIDAPAM